MAFASGFAGLSLTHSNDVLGDYEEAASFA